MLIKRERNDIYKILGKLYYTLNLWYNDIGAKYIVETLKINTTLTTLNLGCNLIEEDSYNEINKLIELNKKYKYMKGKHNLLQEELIEILLVPPDENNIPVLRNGEGNIIEIFIIQYNKNE